MRHGIQRHRSVPLLVANAFLPRHHAAFDTPINLDGDRMNNHVSNIEWRPRWFAILFNRQFRERYDYPIETDIRNLMTGERFENSLECAKHYGLLERDVVQSIMNRTYAWPIYQEFEIVE